MLPAFEEIYSFWFIASAPQVVVINNQIKKGIRLNREIYRMKQKIIIIIISNSKMLILKDWDDINIL